MRRPTLRQPPTYLADRTLLISILPELKTGSRPRCNAITACRLQRELNHVDKSELLLRQEHARAKRAINDLLSNAASNWKPFVVERPITTGSMVFSLAPAAAQQPSSDLAIELIKAAVETKSVDIIETLTQKLMAIPERGDYFAVSPRDAVRLIVLPTLQATVGYLKDNPPEESLSGVLRQLKRGLSQVLLEYRDLRHIYDFPTIFEAVGAELDADYLQNGYAN